MPEPGAAGVVMIWSMVAASMVVRMVRRLVRWSWQTYREYWFRTYARSGAWSTSWTWKDGRLYSTAEDVPPESGYTAASPNTYVRVTAYWYSGSTAAGATSEWAWTSRSPNYPYVCNSGQPYAIS